ncbi:hypothetical protein LAV_00204 [Sphingobium phage Lacusarx]|uniref:Uncharacterized protein n=1 Tax=Sphingobium phage Lacusarx TaxID=1980139 RepID=A0A1W6DXG7_9CAUD|nr:hypothetical protein FDH44_gp099 [Sphingobium phage Lacusarx]ARK07579.1 hypothetical protein LAV_00204 [Sphingobium phage Lacusarx]
MGTLDQRKAAFASEPCTATARRYATELLDYWADDMIGRDTLRNGLIEIATGLTEGRNDIGQRVAVTVEGR